MYSSVRLAGKNIPLKNESNLRGAKQLTRIWVKQIRFVYRYRRYLKIQSSGIRKDILYMIFPCEWQFKIFFKHF